ncbi:MAG TPA: ubiquinone/menaquinone biosynthesis methyltransferase [Thermoanaerobaculia bacterium]|nr:ubiquinone/menaquinone biosynthesis methyltransferase [Thermoanaerobaculia bacterium]
MSSDHGFVRTGLDKSAAAVRDMFGAVAPRYDLLNHLLSASLDRSWRRRAAERVSAAAPAGPVLDLCSGTGDQAVAVARGGRPVAAVDSCLPMLGRARSKLRGQAASAAPAAADALSLPFSDARFAAVTIAFGLRNVEDPAAALAEIERVLAPRGTLVVLEFAVPRRYLVRAAYLLYFRHLVPAIAAVLSPRGPAYRYLRDSVLEFPQRDALRPMLEGAGFEQVSWTDLSGGTVCLYQGSKPSASSAAR